jgi:hypothetical protein
MLKVASRRRGRALLQAYSGADLGEPDLCFAQREELENHQALSTERVT